MTELQKINVLGMPYAIIVKKYDEEPEFESRDIVGFCDGYAKEIVLCDLATHRDYKHEEPKTMAPYRNCNLRHEIVHAFLFESGLAQNSGDTNAWAQNEEMVDWIARQGPKIYEAWKEAACI